MSEAFAAQQWQGTGAKNQIVMGLNGQQAVLSAQGFGLHASTCGDFALTTAFFR